MSSEWRMKALKSARFFFAEPKKVIVLIKKNCHRIYNSYIYKLHKYFKHTHHTDPRQFWKKCHFRVYSMNTAESSLIKHQNSPAPSSVGKQGSSTGTGPTVRDEVGFSTRAWRIGTGIGRALTVMNIYILPQRTQKPDCRKKIVSGNICGGYKVYFPRALLTKFQSFSLSFLSYSMRILYF